MLSVVATKKLVRRKHMHSYVATAVNYGRKMFLTWPPGKGFHFHGLGVPYVESDPYILS
jgi:hypothetical protein